VYASFSASICLAIDQQFQMNILMTRLERREEAMTAVAWVIPLKNTRAGSRHSIRLAQHLSSVGFSAFVLVSYFIFGCCIGRVWLPECFLVNHFRFVATVFAYRSRWLIMLCYLVLSDLKPFFSNESPICNQRVMFGYSFCV
jgi:hypothetical protein